MRRQAGAAWECVIVRSCNTCLQPKTTEVEGFAIRIIDFDELVAVIIARTAWVWQ
jgi:hypothetical protein